VEFTPQHNISITQNSTVWWLHRRWYDGFKFFWWL